MSGRVQREGLRVRMAAGASAHGGLLVIDGDAALRCGISLKGVDIVVGGSVGSFSAFMAQAGRMVICGDAGDALGDSLYEAVHLRARRHQVARCRRSRVEPMTRRPTCAVLSELLERGRLRSRPARVQARRLRAQPLPLERRRGSGVLRPERRRRRR